MSLDYLPVSYDPATKKLSLSDVQTAFPELSAEIDQLNTIAGEIVAFGDVPPVPSKDNFNKQLSMMIKKMHDGGIVSFKKENYQEAAKQFSIGLEMISRRAKYESFQFTLQELGLFLISRCDSYLKAADYLRAYNDADLLLGLQVNTPDNFLRRGVCNFFLKNYEASRADYERGLSFDSNNERLKIELGVVINKLKEENGEI